MAKINELGWWWFNIIIIDINFISTCITVMDGRYGF
jgi:hypothetical protein